MKRLGGVLFGSVAAGVGLTLVASAAGTAAKSHERIRQVQGRIEALAIDGNRIAYDVGSTLGKNNNTVVVWDLRTGKTTTVSGKRTRMVDNSSTGSGVFQLAIAGTRVAWLANVGGNTEGDDYLFSSSVTKPKEQRLAWTQRFGDNCAGRSAGCSGPWLGGLVGSGGLLAFNRWTTDDTGTVADGGLYVLNGTSMQSIATGTDTVAAAAADRNRVAVLRSDGTVGLYSSAGDLLRTVQTNATAVAWNVHELVVLTKTRRLMSYYSPSATLSRNVSLPGKQMPGNLDVQGTIAIYTVGGAVHAFNLGNRKDRVIGKLSGGIGSARISSAGVVYSSNRFSTKGTLVFLPWATVAAAVAG